MMGGFDMNHMFQMYSTGIMMKMMNTVNDTSGGLFTYDKIIALVVLFLLNDIKKWVLEFVDFLKKSVTENVPILAQKGRDLCIDICQRAYQWRPFDHYYTQPHPVICDATPAHNEEYYMTPSNRFMTVELDLNTFNMNAVWQYIQMTPDERAKLGATCPDGVRNHTTDQVTATIGSKDQITTNLTFKDVAVQITPALTMEMHNLQMNVNNITGALVGATTDVAAANAGVVVFDIENNEIFKNIVGGDSQYCLKLGHTKSMNEFIRQKFKTLNDAKKTLSDYRLSFEWAGNTLASAYVYGETDIHKYYEGYYATRWYGVEIYKIICMCLLDKNLIHIKTDKERIFVLETILVLFYIFEYFANINLAMQNTNYIATSNCMLFGSSNLYFKLPMQKINAYLHSISAINCFNTTRPAFIDNCENCESRRSTNAAATPKPAKTQITLSTTDLGKPNDAIYHEFLDFYRTVLLKAPEASKSAQFSKTRDITVYAISYKKTDEVKTVDNPDYAEWMEMFGSAAKAASASPPTIDAASTDPQKPASASSGAPAPAPHHQSSYEMLAKMEAYKMKPPKTVEIRAQKSELVCEKVNKLYKNMQSLYLREADKRKITSIVDNFKNRRDFYEQLGIPYKLGIMLYGHPGTGKSSTIKAVASTLEKDIYFVNLKNVSTNAELKGIFDHINEKCNGGVIVFEDMDASCDVIKRRTSAETRPDAVADLTDHVADDKLTLSYLLNLFDGTICRDGTIFAITTNHLENIDPALYRAGRVDVKIEFRKCDHYQVGQIFRHIIGREIAADVLADIPEWKYSPAEIIYEIMHYGLDDTATDREIMSTFI